MAAESLPLDVVREPRRAAALLDPQRLALLEALATPDSAAAVARRLGLPRQRVGYHLRLLEEMGLIETVEERRKGNVMERLVRAKARHYVLSPELLGALGADPRNVRDRFSSAYLAALAARTLQELGRLRAAADEQGKKVPTLGIDLEVSVASPTARKAFTEDLANAVADVVRKHHDPEARSARSFRVTVGAYPSIPEAPQAQGEES